ncbi:hypothetical protein F5884DRAFT_837295 [Xylogone sp. PMI_703]|nr:hypothetical protein F5884DRAFT_837295 [Xylogone sp. PMI_703]
MYTIMQGTDKLHLVHLPMFYMANHRYQVIITGDLDPTTMKKYLNARAQHPDRFFVLGNHNKDTLAAITTEGASFQADVFMGLPFLDHETIAEDVKLSNVHVIIKESMATSNLLPDYPMQMPFYLYGTKHQKHIDHALLHAPDQQLNSDQRNLSTDKEVPEDDLKKGVVAVFPHVYERSMQPMQRPGKGEVDHSSFKVPGFDFSAGQTFSVTIFKSLDSHGNGQDLIARGTIKLSKSVFADNYESTKTIVPTRKRRKRIIIYSVSLLSQSLRLQMSIRPLEAPLKAQIGDEKGYEGVAGPIWKGFD